MDATRFDRLARSLSTGGTRRGLLGLLAALPLLGSLLTADEEAAAKGRRKRRKARNRRGKKQKKGSRRRKQQRRKKVTLCHDGQTIRVKKSQRKKHLRHGDTRGACQSPPPPPGPPVPPPPGCDPGFHRCGETCVRDDAVEHCGTSCTPCDPPANATATCDGSTCGFVCNTGYHPCGIEGACYADDDAAHCGPGCAVCDAQCQTCNGTACVAVSNDTPCNTGHCCNGVCPPNPCPANANCGTAQDACGRAVSCGGPCGGTTPICVTNVCTACSAGQPCESGCCASDGSCQGGTEDGACGAIGGACVACGPGRRCVGRTCVCDPISCPGGCCDDQGRCQVNNNHACGTGGAACSSSCSASWGQVCSGGTCRDCSAVCSGCEYCFRKADGSWYCGRDRLGLYCSQVCTPSTICPSNSVCAEGLTSASTNAFQSAQDICMESREGSRCMSATVCQP